MVAGESPATRGMLSSPPVSLAARKRHPADCYRVAPSSEGQKRGSKGEALLFDIALILGIVIMVGFILDQVIKAWDGR